MPSLTNPRFEFTAHSDIAFPRLYHRIERLQSAKAEEERRRAAERNLTNHGVVTSEDHHRHVSRQGVQALRNMFFTALSNAVNYYDIPTVNTNSTLYNSRHALIDNPLALLTATTIDRSTEVRHAKRMINKVLERHEDTSTGVPNGSMVLTKQVLGTRSGSVYLPAIVRGYNSQNSRYLLEIFPRNNEPAYMEERRREHLICTYGMLIDMVNVVMACDAVLTWYDENPDCKLKVAGLVSAVHLGCHIHFKGHDVPLKYKDYITNEVGRGAGYPDMQRYLSSTHEMISSPSVGLLFTLFKPVFMYDQPVATSVTTTPLDPRNYSYMKTRMRVHSRRLTEHNRYRFSTDHIMSAQLDDSHLVTASKVHPDRKQMAMRDAKWMFKTMRQESKLFGVWFGRLVTALRNRNVDQIRTVMADTATIDVLVNTARFIGNAGSRRISAYDHSMYYMVTGLLNTLSVPPLTEFVMFTNAEQFRGRMLADCVRVVDYYTSPSDMSYGYVVPEELSARCIEYEGQYYMREIMYRWSDNVFRPTREPAPIVGYHESKRYVGYIPTPMKPPYLGLELEVEVTGDETREAVARKVRKLGNDDFGMRSPLYLSCERDGSISNGFEIVTGYTGVDVHSKHLKAVLTAGLKISNSGNTGLHVHICKKGASLMHMARIDKFMHAESTYKLILAVARRAPNNYCTREANKDSRRRMLECIRARVGSIRGSTSRERWRKAISTLRNDLTKRMNEARYAYVNFHNEHTMEFRVFKSSTKYGEVMAALEFTSMVWRFCQYATDTQINTEEFCKYISRVENRKETANLRNLLAEAGFRVFIPNTNKTPNKPATAVAA